MKRVLIVDAISHTGGAYYSFSFAETLARKGVRVTYAHSSGWILKHKERSFKTVRIFTGTRQTLPLLIRAVSFMFSWIRLIMHIAVNKYDIVHFQYFVMPKVEYMVISTLKYFGFKIYVTAHEIDDIHGMVSSTRVIHSIFQISNKVFALNRSSVERLRAIGVRPSAIVEAAHGGYEYFLSLKLSKQECRIRLGLVDNITYLLLFGTLTERKGLPVLLRALEIIVNEKQITDIHLLVIGRPLRSYDLSKDLAAATYKGLSSFITLRNEFISDEFVECYFRACDLVIIPYLSIAESGVLRHAFSIGCAVIAANLSAFSQIAENEKNCLLFHVGDADELASRIIELKKNKALRARIGFAAVDTMGSKYSWDSIITGVLPCYTDCNDGQIISKC